MKKIILFSLIFLMIFPTVAFLQENEENTELLEQNNDIEQERESSIGENTLLFQDTFRNIDVVKLNENQMALLMINNQIGYLMTQIQAHGIHTENLVAKHREELAREQEKQNILKEEQRTKVEKLESRLSEKEAAAIAAGEKVHELEKKIAVYIGESGLYLKLVLTLIIGMIAGLILGGILNWKKNRNQIRYNQKQVQSKE